LEYFGADVIDHRAEITNQFAPLLITRRQASRLASLPNQGFRVVFDLPAK
jgi:hypothetical protein